MAGPGTEFFTGKQQQYEQIVSEAATAQQKLLVTNEALALLKKPTLSQDEAEQLVALVQQA